MYRRAIYSHPSAVEVEECAHGGVAHHSSKGECINVCRCYCGRFGAECTLQRLQHLADGIAMDSPNAVERGSLQHTGVTDVLGRTALVARTCGCVCRSLRASPARLTVKPHPVQCTAYRPTMSRIRPYSSDVLFKTFLRVGTL